MMRLGSSSMLNRRNARKKRNMKPLFLAVIVLVGITCVSLVLFTEITAQPQLDRVTEIINEFIEHSPVASAKHNNNSKTVDSVPPTLIQRDTSKESSTQSMVKLVPHSPMHKWPQITDKCEGLFGNAFDPNPIIQCASQSSPFNFNCHQNTVSKAVYCDASNLIIDPTKIDISEGGEDISAVRNRNEDNEYPNYNDDSFIIGCIPDGDIPIRRDITFYQHDVVSHLQRRDQSHIDRYDAMYQQYCDKGDDDVITIVVMTTRYEYANLYHTATDWYNFYQILHTLGINRSSFQVVFLDGHSWGSLDDAWEPAFGPFTYIKRLNSNRGPICAKRAILIPPGYIGGIALKSMMQHRCKDKSKYVSEFGQWFANGFGIVPNANDGVIKISIICRKDYTAHPRSVGKKTSRKFKDDSEVQKWVQSAVDESSKSVEVKRLYLEDLNVRQQILAMSETDILIGVHGAGLTHILFLPPNRGVIEIVPSGYEGRIHFSYMSKWCGHEYLTVKATGNDFQVTPSQGALGVAVQKLIDKLTP